MAQQCQLCTTKVHAVQQSCYTPQLQGKFNHLQDSGTCRFRRDAHGYLAVKAPCPPQGWIQRIWPVGSTYNHTLFVVLRI
jgi:hypothetical protein